MTTSTDPEDGSLVEREGVDAGSARSTAEGPLLTGGTTTGRPGDRAQSTPDETEGADVAGQGAQPGQRRQGGQGGHGGQGAPVTQPAQVWADSTGGVADPAATYDSESGQDEGSID